MHFLKNEIIVILLKELLILPNQEIKIELNNKLSKQIIKQAIDNYDSKLLVVAPLDSKEEEPNVEDLPRVGVIAKIKNKIELPNNNLRVTLRGINRIVIDSYYPATINPDILNAAIRELELPKFVPSEENAIKRKLLATLKEYIDSADNISNSVLTLVHKTKNLSNLTDIIASFLNFNYEKKCEYMQNINPLNRAISLINDLKEEIEILKLDEEIDEKLRISMEENQKEFILKERLKVIQAELGEKTTQEKESELFLAQLEKLKLNSATKTKLANEIAKYALLNETSPEFSVLRTYLDWTLNLPWQKETKDPGDSQKVITDLDQTHYGLKEIKNRISEYIAIKNLNKDLKSPIICLVGPPGVGKTSIAMAIASVLKRKFYKISVGGLNDSTELIGSRRTYLGANPGKIIQALRKAGSKNPVILIDEVDKMTKDYRGDPASTLLEIIDPVQNQLFTDNYIEEPFDLSNVLFILTANNIENIPETILDRVEVIKLNSYTIFEKQDIAKNYLIPKIKKELNGPSLNISAELLSFIITNYTNEAGVRELERILATIYRKAIIKNKKRITQNDIQTYLGLGQNFKNPLSLGKYGEVNILAVSGYGGYTTKLEVVTYPGTGKIIITGLVGDTMDESVRVAISYLKNKYKISLDKKDLHLHFLDGATKKNGPSAGLAIAVGILSLLKKQKIAKNIAFSGELSLNGEVLRIGGLKEKLIAAYNNDVSVVYIPKANSSDLDYIPSVIRQKITINLVSDFKDVYTKLFK